MPELPEVENVVRTLNENLELSSPLKQFTFYRDDLRWKIPKEELLKLVGRRITKIWRRAKYIIFEMRDQAMISHLGMTGQWTILSPAFKIPTRENQSVELRTARKVQSDEVRSHTEFHPHFQPQKHDHVQIKFENGAALIYTDPRRFGFLEVVRVDQLATHFSELGPEPSLDREWQPDELAFLIARFKKSTKPIKNALMDQQLIVGVGNIYACEALFECGINPKRQANRVTKKKYEHLFGAVREILNLAIKMGGSSISDYRDSVGKKGDFQSKFKVYDRAGEECNKCGHKIRRIVQAGRSTFYCPACQVH